MKLKIIKYAGQVKSACLFTTNWVGSTDCTRCKSYVKSESTSKYVECKRATEMVEAIEAMRYKEETSNNWFKYKFNDVEETTGEVEHLDHLVTAYKKYYIKINPESNVNEFLNLSKHKRGNPKLFGIGEEFDSSISLRQYLYDRNILEEFLSLI